MKKVQITPEKWIESSIESALGTIWMAGKLHGKSAIARKRMRILGRHALVLVLEGNVYYEDATGYQDRLRPGDALMVSPTLAHAYGSIDQNPWTQIYAIFDGPQFDLLANSATYTAHQPVWHLEPVDLWQNRLEEVLKPRLPGAPSKALRTVGRFTSLLIEMAAADATARQDPSEAWLEESLRLLGEPQGSDWMGPHDVARKIGQSYETFRKRFVEKIGKPPGQFQKKRRIDLACAAIYQGDDNFKDLSEKLGFCDVYHFSKVFRQVVGSPPAAYRRTVRGG